MSRWVLPACSPMKKFLLSCAICLPASLSFADDSHPLEPKDALKTFAIEEGLTIELVASEPQVIDPVAIAFDAKGRMYVAEYRDYPLGPGEGKEPLSRIKLLEDVDGDGFYEKATVFANVPWAQGVLVHGKGLIVTASPKVLYLEDTDGDGVADVQVPLLDGFTFGNPQLRVGHPSRGLDQKIYLTNGLTGGNVVLPNLKEEDKKPVTMGRNDVAYDPLTKTFELVPGQAQFGNTFDDFGNRFFCTNRNPIIYAPMSRKMLNRNTFAPAIVAQEDVAPSGGASRVFPRIETKTTAVSHAGTHTAACGTHVYRGQKFGYEKPDDIQVFVCEPTASLVTRTILRPSGTTFSSHRPYERRDFLTSTDTWFRPVSLAEGPDGAMYLADMYREVIEHPQYMPPGLAETLRLRAGDDRGRIYRIRRTNQKFEKPATPVTVADFLKLLGSQNGWDRDLAQHELLNLATDSNKAEIIAGVDQHLGNANAKVAVQSLWTLAGLQRRGLLDDKELSKRVTQQIGNANSHVVEHAIRVLTENGLSPALLQDLDINAKSFNDRVAFVWIDAVSSLSKDSIREQIGQIIARSAKDHWLPKLALTLPPDNATDLLNQLLKSAQFLKEGNTAERDLISFLSNIIGRRGITDELVEILDLSLNNVGESVSWSTSATLFGLQQGLLAGKGIDNQKTFEQLAKNKSEKLAALSGKANEVFPIALKTLQQTSAPLLDRQAAVPALSYAPVDQALAVVKALLLKDEDASLLRACSNTIAGRAREAYVKEMIAVWPNLGPNSRGLVIEAALAHPATTTLLLETMVAGKISPNILSIDQRDPLLMTRNEQLKTLAEKLFGQATSTDRAAVIEKYKPAVTMKGDAKKGREVYTRMCAQCHKIGDEGALVGPELSDIRAKTGETLLSDILDPSRAIEPRWTSYVAVLEDGRVVNGLLVRESTSNIVLRRAKGVEDTIERSEIEVLKASEQSLMPAGIESEVTVEQMADLLAFLKGGQ